MYALKTAIVILNWNGISLLREFIPILKKYTAGKARLIVGDNASSDGSVVWLRETHPDVEILTNPVNEGFAKGYNSILSRVDAEYFVLLNSDVEVTEGWLAPMESFLDTHPEVAICQPKLLDYRTRQKFEYAGAAGGFIDRYGYPFCRGRLFAHLETDHGQYNEAVPVFWASGACMMIRSSIFKQIKGFDPAFFAHMEEIDLCWRVRNAGHEIFSIPQSAVYHIGGGTLPKNNPNKTLLNFRNNLSMLYKNLPSNRLFTVIFSRLILDGIAALRFLSEGHVRDAAAVFEAHVQFYQRVLNGTFHRDKTMPHKDHVTIFPQLIVWEYFVRGKRKFSDLDFHPGQTKNKR